VGAGGDFLLAVATAKEGIVARGGRGWGASFLVSIYGKFGWGWDIKGGHGLCFD